VERLVLLGGCSKDFRATNWLAARQQLDCPMTCKTVDMYVIMSGTDHKDRKPISVCTTKKGRNGEWLVGYNRWKESTCNVTINKNIVVKDIIASALSTGYNLCDSRC